MATTKFQRSRAILQVLLNKSTENYDKDDYKRLVYFDSIDGETTRRFFQIRIRTNGQKLTLLRKFVAVPVVRNTDMIKHRFPNINAITTLSELDTTITAFYYNIEEKYSIYHKGILDDILEKHTGKRCNIAFDFIIKGTYKTQISTAKHIAESLKNVCTIRGYESSFRFKIYKDNVVCVWAHLRK